MKNFLIIEARKMIPFRDKPEELARVLINTSKITSGEPEKKQLYLKGVGEYQLEKAEWDKVMTLLGINNEPE